MNADLQTSWYSRWLFERGLASIYTIAFLVTVNQILPLVGEHGLLPAVQFVAQVPVQYVPSIFHWFPTDAALVSGAWLGVTLSVLALTGLPERVGAAASAVVWAALYVLYLSIINVGQTFYSFGWESLLVELGFFTIFAGARITAPHRLLNLAYRWTLFRLMFGAGLIKLRGDACWRNLTCTRYHHETQPLPNPLSWRFHHLPDWMHRAEVLGNHAAQLVAPWLLFLPQPVAGIGAVVMIVTQCWLLLSGNFSWLNLVTIVIVAAALPGHAGGSTTSPTWWVVLGLVASALIVVLSIRPALNLVSKRQLMNSSFDPLRLVNTYGAFGHVTKHRDELIIEGTHDALTTPSTQWQPYEFKAKPGDPHRRPRQVAPYHLRLDWLMWFAALGSPAPWLDTLVDRLLHGDAATLRLLGANPFPDEPPAQIRVVTYRYRFTTKVERTQTGDWWHRQLVGTYLPARRLDYRRRT
jgi:hypothetical protein